MKLCPDAKFLDYLCPDACSSTITITETATGKKYVCKMGSRSRRHLHQIIGAIYTCKKFQGEEGMVCLHLSTLGPFTLAKNYRVSTGSSFYTCPSWDGSKL